MRRETVVELQAVCYRHPGAVVPLLNSVSLACEAGRIYGLYGPNGSGKTTLFNILSGFLRPSSGRILYYGNEVQAHDAITIASFGKGLTRTFQVPTVVDDLSVQDNLWLGVSCPKASLREFLRPAAMLTSGQHQQRVASILAALKLTQYAERPAGELSFGLRRLLATGMALARETGILLLDEPFANLHADTVALVAKAIRVRVERCDSMVLVIDHLARKLAGLADAVYCLNEGVGSSFSHIDVRRGLKSTVNGLVP